MKQKSTFSHHKPKTVDKGKSGEGWSQVFTDIRQSLGFSDGAQKPDPKKPQPRPSEKKVIENEKIIKQPRAIIVQETVLPEQTEII